MTGLDSINGGSGGGYFDAGRCADFHNIDKDPRRYPTYQYSGRACSQLLYSVLDAFGATNTPNKLLIENVKYTRPHLNAKRHQEGYEDIVTTDWNKVLPGMKRS